MKRTLNELRDVFNVAKNNSGSFVAVVVKMKEFPKNEVIINSYENIALKLEYYEKAYDENLNHRFSEGISIVDFMWANSIEQLSRYFLVED